MERASLFHLEVNGMRKLVNVTYLGGNECLSIWLETYTCVIKWLTQWIPFLGKPLSQRNLGIELLDFLLYSSSFMVGFTFVKVQTCIGKIHSIRL
jgi:hypothetical protein